MKKPLFLFLLGVLASGLPLVVLAGHGPLHLNLEYPEFGGFDLNEDQSITEIIAFLYYFIVSIAGLAVFVMLIWAGIQWLSSAGNPSQIADARDRAKQALLGLLLVLASFLIIQVINPELTVIGLPGIDAGTRASPGYQYYGQGSYTSAPPGETVQGIYLCDRANCAGGQFLRIDFPSACIVLPDLSNASDLESKPCVVHSNPEDPDWTNWDERVRAVRVNVESEPFGFMLFDKPAPAFDVTERVVCFLGSVDDLDLYNIKPGEGWGDKAGGFLGITGGPDSACKNPGLTYKNFKEDYQEPTSNPIQPAVFFFQKVAYGQEEETIFDLPLERWKPNSENTGEREDRYGEGREEGKIGPLPCALCDAPNVRSLWITDAILCGFDVNGDGEIGQFIDGVGNTVKERTEQCAVRLWHKDTMDPTTDANICFKESVEDLHQYTFKCKGDDLVDDIHGVQVIPASECAYDRQLVTCE